MSLFLIDSNVLIAAFVGRSHPHGLASADFLAGPNAPNLTTAAHCLSEAYNNLTRARLSQRLEPSEAIRVLAEAARVIRVVQLSPAQTLDAIGRFAARGGIGRRLYDYVIGATGEAFGAHTIVTWNVRHFDTLFPHLRVATPADLAQ